MFGQSSLYDVTRESRIIKKVKMAADPMTALDLVFWLTFSNGYSEKGMTQLCG